MKTFLILSDPQDLHASYVSWALRKAGYEVRYINSQPDNCPAKTTLYLDGAKQIFSGTDWSYAEAAWCRRFGYSLGYGLLGKQSTDEDEVYIRGENSYFTKCLIGLQNANSPRWINYPPAELRAENKFIQLKTASACGITVPRTLVTSEPTQFRAFLDAEGVVVAKTLSTFNWKPEPGKTLAPYATLVDAKQGAELTDEEIARCVTIYQQRIEKVNELRVIIMGRDIFAYRVIQCGEQHFDYRIGFHNEDPFRFELFPLPSGIREKILAFMDELQINFASSDFVLTEDGDWVFLDLNPGGQWMFIEDGHANSLVGQRFCSFFVNGSVSLDAADLFPSISEYHQSDEAAKLTEFYKQHYEA